MVYLHMSNMISVYFSKNFLHLQHKVGKMQLSCDDTYVYLNGQPPEGDNSCSELNNQETWVVATCLGQRISSRCHCLEASIPAWPLTKRGRPCLLHTALSQDQDVLKALNHRAPSSCDRWAFRFLSIARQLAIFLRMTPVDHLRPKALWCGMHKMAGSGENHGHTGKEHTGPQ